MFSSEDAVTKTVATMRKLSPETVSFIDLKMY